jgi:hypothetical protein
MRCVGERCKQLAESDPDIAQFFADASKPRDGRSEGLDDGNVRDEP